VDAQGHPFLIDLRDTVVSQAILYDGAWEPEKAELFSTLIQLGDRVVDVGANIGYYSVLFGHAVGTSGRVVGIEPDPDNARLARENVRLNGLSHTVSIVQAAAGAQRGDLVLYARSGISNRGDHRTWSDGSHEGRRVRVKMVTVDEYVRDWPSVQTIKMDIQGYEGHALGGMRSTLQQNAGIALVAEFWPSSIRRAGSEPHAFLDTLHDLGFTGWRIDDRGALAAVDTETIVAELEPDERWADMVFMRQEHAKQRLGKLFA
jgi:FkbM family methyltransferase